MLGCQSHPVLISQDKSLVLFIDLCIFVCFCFSGVTPNCVAYNYTIKA